MKKFIFKLMALSGAVVLAVLLVHVVVIMSYQKDVDAVYTLSPDQRYLFIGSSQFNTFASDKPGFHNKLIAVVDSGLSSYLLELWELERRGQLDNVKILFVPFSEHVVEEEKRQMIFKGWYKQLPVSWRYLNRVPWGLVPFLGYVATSLRYPLPLIAADNYNTDKNSPSGLSVNERPPLMQKSIYRDMDWKSSTYDFPAKLEPGCRDRLMECFAEMKRICDAHGIRLIAVGNPMLRYFYDRIPECSKAYTAKCIAELEAMGIEHVAIDAKVTEDEMTDQIHIAKNETRVRVLNRLYEQLGLK